MRVCVALKLKSVSEVVRVVEERWREADLFEVRIDLLDEKRDLSRLRKLRDKLIATVRWRLEGGSFTGSEDERLNLYLSVMREVKPKYVDVEISSGIIGGVVRAARREGVDVIGSYHNFKETPGVDSLKKIEEKAREMGVDLLKVVTMAKSFKDNLTIFNFLSEVEMPTVSFCMGRHGVISRVISPLLGSKFTYAALNKGLETAPGQLTIDELRSVWRLMGVD